MTTAAVETVAPRRSQSQREWQRIAAARPRLADTAARYLAQLGLSLRPASVVVADAALRQLALYLIDTQPHVVGFADVGRAEIEAFKLHLGRPAGPAGDRQRQHVPAAARHPADLLRPDRIGEWDWDDAPRRTPIYSIDLPVVDDPLPKFLDDAQAGFVPCHQVPIPHVPVCGALEPESLGRTVLVGPEHSHHVRLSDRTGGTVTREQWAHRQIG